MISVQKSSPPPSQELVEQAENFCYLVDHIGEFLCRSWLGEISGVLSRIHAAIGCMDRGRQKKSFDDTADIEARFDMFCRLKRTLGERDVYEVNAEPGGVLCGSLADDFTDLYFELKRGLDLLHSDVGGLSAALQMWREGYWWHWGQHLLDAERHLYNLRIHNQIQ